MRWRVRDQKEFLAGTIFTVIGLVWAWQATLLRLGTATAMGPGYFPLVVALVLAGIGLLSVAHSLTVERYNKLEPWHVLPIVSILVGVVVFALLIERAGVIVASIALILLCNPRRVFEKPFEMAVLALATATFVAALFVYVLGLPIPLV